MSQLPSQFNELQLSALNEVINTGCSHTATALSNLTSTTYKIVPTSINTLSIDQLPQIFGNLEELSVGVVMFIDQPFKAYLALFFNWDNAKKLWKLLLGNAPDHPEKISELEESTMVEVGNILHSAFLNAFSDLTGETCLANAASVAIDMKGSIAFSLFADAEFHGALGFYTETKIKSEKNSIDSCFLCIPTRKGLDFLFGKIGKDLLYGGNAGFG